MSRGFSGVVYEPGFVSAADRSEIVRWTQTIHPIWEKRYSAHHPAPAGKEGRSLLRPVYWLGNWQFACLGYYHPPRGTRFRCVQAEAFPPVFQRLVARIERGICRDYPPSFIPRGWHLNTCLVNLYGMREVDGKSVDTARVGEHKDFEPGPVASLSFGDRALFQFVSSRGKGHPSSVILQQWLEDCSLQVFAGPRWKDQLFHRVQRVEKKKPPFALDVQGFVTRRINFTFRYVPDKDIVPFSKLPKEDAEDVAEYMRELAQYSPFFKKALSTSRVSS